MEAKRQRYTVLLQSVTRGFLARKRVRGLREKHDQLVRSAAERAAAEAARRSEEDRIKAEEKRAREEEVALRKATEEERKRLLEEQERRRKEEREAKERTEREAEERRREIAARKAAEAQQAREAAEQARRQRDEEEMQRKEQERARLEEKRKRMEDEQRRRREEEGHRQEQAMQVLMQQQMRGFMVRCEQRRLTEVRAHVAAARVIQRAWRAYKARHRLRARAARRARDSLLGNGIGGTSAVLPSRRQWQGGVAGPDPIEERRRVVAALIIQVRFRIGYWTQVFPSRWGCTFTPLDP